LKVGLELGKGVLITLSTKLFG